MACLFQRRITYLVPQSLRRATYPTSGKGDLVRTSVPGKTTDVQKILAAKGMGDVRRRGFDEVSALGLSSQLAAMQEVHQATFEAGKTTDVQEILAAKGMGDLRQRGFDEVSALGLSSQLAAMNEVHQATCEAGENLASVSAGASVGPRIDLDSTGLHASLYEADLTASVGKVSASLDLKNSSASVRVTGRNGEFAQVETGNWEVGAGVSGHATAGGRVGLSLDTVETSSVDKVAGSTHVEVAKDYDLNLVGNVNASAGASARIGGVSVGQDYTFVDKSVSEKVCTVATEKASIDTQQDLLEKTTTVEVTAASQESAEALRKVAEQKVEAVVDTVVPPGVCGGIMSAARGDGKGVKKAVVGGAVSTVAKLGAAAALTTTTATTVPAAGVAGMLGFQTTVMVTTGPGAIVLIPLGIAAGWLAKKLMS